MLFEESRKPGCWSKEEEWLKDENIVILQAEEKDAVSTVCHFWSTKHMSRF